MTTDAKITFRVARESRRRVGRGTRRSSSASAARQSGRTSRNCARSATTSRPARISATGLWTNRTRCYADDLLARLGKTKVIGRDIRVFEQTTSTNDVIEKLARDGVREGVVVFAESQTKGRGRLGRKWISPERKGLWFSVLLRPDLRPQEATQLTVASATALRRAIQSETGLKPEIKWPNDMLVGGKKVAGILTELSAELDRVKHVILGIGVDVNLGAGEFPPELRKHGDLAQNRSGPGHFARRNWRRQFCANWMLITRGFAPGNFRGIADEWEKHCATIGREVTVQIGDRKIRGQAESLDDAGALLLRTEHGAARKPSPAAT